MSPLNQDAESDPQEKKKKTRAGGTKVKTGCITCRIRRVKCDEEKPSCRRCTSTGRKCDGYAFLREVVAVNVPQSRSSELPITQWILSDIPGTRKDLRTFDFFRSRTAPILSGYFDSEFWNGLLMQFCHSDLTIRHAMMAVSSIHEQFETANNHGIGNYSSSSGDGVNLFALHHYNLAIRSMNDRLSSSRLPTENLLITCVLFTCLEFLRGEQDVAVGHLQSGSRILFSHQEQSKQRLGGYSCSSSNYHLIEDVLLPIFSRLNVLASLFGKPAPDLLPKFSTSVSEYAISPPLSFSTVFEARTAIVGIANAVMGFDLSLAGWDLGLVDFRQAREKQIAIGGLLQRWSSAFADFINSSLASLSSRDIRGTSLLLLQHKALSLMLSSSLTREQVMSEDYDQDFETIISLSEFIIGNDQSNGAHDRIRSEFSFEMGVVPQLYLAAVKCNSPSIRKKARDLLSSSPRREGLWCSVQAAEAAEKIMVIEGKVEALSVSAELYKECISDDGVAKISYPNPLSAADAVQLRYSILSAGSTPEPEEK